MERKVAVVLAVFLFTVFMALAGAQAGDKVAVDMYGGDLGVQASSGMGEDVSVNIDDDAQSVSVDIDDDTQNVSVEDEEAEYDSDVGVSVSGGNVSVNVPGVNIKVSGEENCH